MLCKAQDFFIQARNEVGSFGSRSVTRCQYKDDDFMLAERVKLGRAAAYAFVASEHDPGFLTRDCQPFFVGRVGSKTLVVSNIIRADLVQRFAQKAAPGAAVNK